jgi:hypothetical protein
MIAGDNHHMPLYRKDVPVLLESVLKSNRCDLRPSRRLPTYYSNAEEK